MGNVTSEISSFLAEDFSLTRGGPMHRLLVLLGNAGDERQRVIRRAISIVLITWLPLLLLSLVHGDAYGTGVRIPFLYDFAVNVRFLVAIPILILAESSIEQGDGAYWSFTFSSLDWCPKRNFSLVRGSDPNDHASA